MGRRVETNETIREKLCNGIYSFELATFLQQNLFKKNYFCSLGVQIY